MNPLLRRKLLSAAWIVGLFVLWEFLCAAFDVSDVVLPRPSQIVTTLVLRFPALWPHTLQTLYTTLVGFVLGVAIGVVFLRESLTPSGLVGLACVVAGVAAMLAPKRG